MESLFKIINGLTQVYLGGYEWRLTMVVLQKTYCSDKEWAELSLDDFQNRTKIKKTHVSRSLSTLQERNILRKRITGGKWCWKINPNTNTWRSFLDLRLPEKIPKKIEIAWQKWIDRFPNNEIYVADAKAMYVALVMQNGNMIEKLEDCLTGYIKLSLHRAEKFNRDPDKLMLMYPTTFLKDGKYENFEQFKYIKKKENW